ncbi:MAG: ferritin family protein [Desulfarculus sp.]|nr:ferritin family protein [Desulfarculus sp.]
MQKFASVDEALDFAIAKEEEAARFYNDVAAKAKPWMAEIFRGFAAEEAKHQAKLLGVKRGQKMLDATAKVQDLHLTDYLVADDNWDGADYQQALILAMKREKSAFKLYTDLAASTQVAELKELFLGLAQEEAKHKVSIEIEYDKVILTDN